MADDLAMMQLLYRIAHAVGGSLRLDETLQAVLHALQETLGVRGVVIRLLNPSAYAFDVAASVGLSQPFLDRIDPRIAPGNVHARMLAKETVSVPDLSAIQAETIQLAHRLDSELLAREHVSGLVALPLQVRDRVFGSLTLYCRDGCGFDETAMTVISAAADLAAIAIQNARLHSALFRIAEALTSSLELQPLLSQVLNATVMEMGLNAASVRLVDRSGKKLDLVASHGLSERYLTKGTILIAASPIDRRVLQGEPVVIFDVAGEEGFQYPEQAAAEGIRSVLAAPLRVKETVVGVMRVYSSQPRQFTRVGVEFLQSVAGLVGVAIENAKLYEGLRTRYEDLKLDVSEWYRFLSLG